MEKNKKEGKGVEDLARKGTRKVFIEIEKETGKGEGRKKNRKKKKREKY